jgi:hypothetical protein
MTLDASAAPHRPAVVTFMLRAEGAAVLVTALVAYWQLGGNWWLFLLLILAPDLSALGYLAGPRLGAMSYNIVHTYALPILIGLLSYFASPHLLPFVAIWLAHIGGDRLLGYGLKDPGSFGQTHLGPIGKARRQAG